MMRSPPLHVISLTAASCPVWMGVTERYVTDLTSVNMQKARGVFFESETGQCSWVQGLSFASDTAGKETHRSKERYQFDRSFKSVLWISELSESPDAALLCFLSTKSTSADQISDRRERERESTAVVLGFAIKGTLSKMYFGCLDLGRAKTKSTPSCHWPPTQPPITPAMSHPSLWHRYCRCEITWKRQLV